MASQSENPCRTALLDALELLDRNGYDGAACYVAMAVDCLDDAGAAQAQPAPPAADPIVQRSA